ncbi:MAG TPA: M48 family peptidase, partial [Armatimonadetes bacterium]|nr:M48 family peptidase [Armatimonadota bacterium]
MKVRARGQLMCWGMVGVGGITAVSLAAQVPPEGWHERAVRYAFACYLLFFLRQSYAWLLLGLLFFTGLSARLRSWAAGCARVWLLQLALYLALVTLLLALAQVPLAWLRGYWLEHHFRLSNYTLSRWWSDWGKALGVNWLLGFPVVAVGYWTVRRRPRTWWLWVTVVMVPFILFFSLIYPVVVDPLFNRFEPLRDPALRARILELAERAGIEDSRVYQVDKSRQTRKLNAYVTGLWGTKRIVLWDTLLKQLSPEEIEFVLAHELGHYVLHHVWHWVVFGSLGTLVVLFLLDRGARIVLARWGEQCRVRKLHDFATYPLVALLLSALNFFGLPVVNA